MNKILKRFVSLILTVAITAGALPLTAFAADGECFLYLSVDEKKLRRLQHGGFGKEMHRFLAEPFFVRVKKSLKKTSNMLLDFR